MDTRRIAVVVFVVAGWLWASSGRAEAQSAPSCSFDAATATLTITVNGQPASLTRPGGQIRLNGVDCSGATATTTDTILINGGGLNDVVTVNGIYEPGMTPEDVGLSEIEIIVDLGDGTDDLRIKTGSIRKTEVTFTPGGIDLVTGPGVLFDGDEDITAAGVEKVRVYTSSGNDTFDATAYVGGGALYLHGGGGDDRMWGSAQADWLYGEEGNDRLYGRDGNDTLYDGPGADNCHGGADNDTLWQDATANGPDRLHGDAGAEDTVNYSKRTNGVFVSLDALADDGESGEGDLVRDGVEIVNGGRGPDVLVGSSARDTFYGGPGDDELYGNGGDDALHGQGGNDMVVGDGGADYLYCGAGFDDADSDPSDAVVYACEL